MIRSSQTVRELRKVGRCVALIGGHGLSACKLFVGVGRPNDLPSLLVDNGESGEAVAGTKLAAPA